MRPMNVYFETTFTVLYLFRDNIVVDEHAQSVLRFVNVLVYSFL